MQTPCKGGIPPGRPAHCRPPSGAPPWLDAVQRVEWEALTRVQRGAVTRRDDQIFDGDKPYPFRFRSLPELYFDALFAIEWVVFRRQSPDDPSLETVSLTDAGRSRLAELNRSPS